MKYQQKFMLMRIINIITLQFVERKADYDYELWNHRQRYRNHHYQKENINQNHLKPLEPLETVRNNKRE